jgi:flavoprotein
MSVRITSTCISFSKARYSAAVSAIFGVAIRSIAGSFARLINKTVLSSAPVSRKLSTKKFDSSNVIPIAANTTAKFSSVPSTLACLAI